MKVLVTGGAGYIGCCLCDQLVRLGHEVIVLDTFNWGTKPIEHLKDKVTYVVGDCRDSKTVIEVLHKRFGKIDSLVHLAGIVGEAACNSNPLAHFSINVESTRTLVNCCTDPALPNLIRDFIYISSCSVYGNVKGKYESVSESTPVSPLSAYADAKVKSEEIIYEAANRIPHFHPTILRLTTVFGWSPRPRLDLVTNLFTYKGWKDKCITINGSGEQYRSLIHVKDVASAIVTTLQAKRFLRDRRIFHVGEEQNNITIKQIAEQVRYYTDSKLIFSKSIETDRRDYKIECNDIKNILGFKAAWDLDMGIQELIHKFNTLDLDWEDSSFRNHSFSYE